MTTPLPEDARYPLYAGRELKPVMTDLSPLIYDSWSKLEPQPPQSDWSLVIEAAQKVLPDDTQIISAKARKPLKADDAILELTLSDDRILMARIFDQQAENPWIASWKQGRVDAELAILYWLPISAIDLPAPRIVNFSGNMDAIITTYIPGLDAEHAYPGMAPAEREASVKSYAACATKLFRVSLPQRFGTPFGVNESNELTVDRIVGLNPDDCFDLSHTTDLSSLFRELIDFRLQQADILRDNDPDMYSRFSSRLDRISTGILPLCSKLDQFPAMYRSALSHQDPRSANVILDPNTGEVAGMIDWEYSACLPAALVADYPPWIQLPWKYSSPDSIFISYYFEPKAEMERLRRVYEDTVKELDEEYWRCLMDGALLREVYYWLSVLSAYDKTVDRWIDEEFGPVS